MTFADWLVLLGTLAFIVIYGTWKNRGSKNIRGYLLGDNEMKWHSIGLSIMATQASAITFLSTPGQAYEDGMRFVQFYFGLPIAMIILSYTVIPIYYRLKVFTAYEYLESRFDLKTRLLAAFLFLIQRGLAAGITIYAPAIILSTILGWPLNLTNFITGVLVIIYTVSGGTRAVSHTQKQQMFVMIGGMVVAFFIIVNLLPDHISFLNAVDVAGNMGKMNIIDFSFDFTTRYTFWSGITGGLFLAMSYFGTDQSQVQRYLSGKSIRESRLGLMFNGLLKVPMQFFILFTGLMVFVFFQFEKPPVYFNESLINKVYSSDYSDEVKQLETAYSATFEKKEIEINRLVSAIESGDEHAVAIAREKVNFLESEGKAIREDVKKLIKKASPGTETKDTDYVFITFIINYLPKGIVGLLLAVILCASMSSTSSELNALASTSTVDLYKRTIKKKASEAHYLAASKWFTVLWGGIAILFAIFASLVDNLIQAVNILGSVFYGTILGIFLVAFYFKKIKANAVFTAAIISEIIVLLSYAFTDIGFLWYNVIGCVLVIMLAGLLSYKLKT